ncbi:type 1 fimbrial protein [Pseudomonas sp. NPDC087697]|uniref:type 1 fimbrial protein n=1 Tax=Pseudomonas sp. NPDC087697 TaxID=3364447 RepID=UPI0037F6EAD4
MNGTRLSVGFSLFFAFSSACVAATPMAQGVIHFSGSIVDTGCTLHLEDGSTFGLYGCPNFARGSAISVRSIEPVRSVGAVNHSRVGVKLVDDKRQDGRYYDQQYALVDSAGKPVSSGAYLISLTYP